MADQIQNPNQQYQQIQYMAEDEINLLELWQVIWKRRKFIGTLAMILVLVTIVTSLFMKNIYQVQAVIVPVTAKETGRSGGALSALASQFGSLPGISLPGASSASEIVSLLNSNILREKIIERYRLMPLLFYKQWDINKNDWKHDSGIDLNPLRLLSKLAGVLQGSDQKSSSLNRKKDFPQLWDALRLLNRVVKVKNNIKENTITLTVDHQDPELAAKMAGYFLDTLTDHMSSEARRVALINRVYLEEQLRKTADPLIRQKIYDLIAQQTETAMMAEVKENFAFKIIDPPKAPDKKIKPKRGLMVMLSFVVAIMIGVFAAFFMEYLEKEKSKQQTLNR